MTIENLKKTPVHAWHVDQQAKMVDFGGWHMPIQYKTGIIKEYEAVRNNMGLFDVSHMGEIHITGAHALDFCQKVSSNNVLKLKPGKIQYSAILNEEAGIIDDCTLYCLNANQYMFVVNASNIEKVYAWFEKQKADLDVNIDNKSDFYALFALQGPKADAFLSRLVQRDLAATVKYYEFNMAQINGVACLISRTGYTGEDGFEIYFDAKEAMNVWSYLIEEGQAESLFPIGLGARDLLRMEMNYLLSGTDFSKETHALEAGLSWICKLDKGFFIGKEAIESRKAEGLKNKIRAFSMLDKGIPRHGYAVFSDSKGKQKIGEVRSGSFSPIAKHGFGLAMLTHPQSVGDPIYVELRPSKFIKAEIRKHSVAAGSIRK